MLTGPPDSLSLRYATLADGDIIRLFDGVSVRSPASKLVIMVFLKKEARLFPVTGYFAKSFKVT